MSKYIDVTNYQDCKIVLHNEDEGIRIRDIPTVDVEPVRHGRWIPLIQRYHWADVRTVSSGIVGFYCSLCGTEEKFKYRYCHCGAKMDEV